MESQWKSKMISCSESWGHLGQIEAKISMGNHRQLSRGSKLDFCQNDIWSKMRSHCNPLCVSSKLQSVYFYQNLHWYDVLMYSVVRQWKPPETSRNLQNPPKTGWGGFWQVFYAWSSKQHLENLQEAAKSQRATKIVFMLEICCKQKACSNKAVLIILRSYMKKQASKGHNWSRIVFYALNMLQTRNVEMRLFINESQFKLKMITCGESWGRLGQIETKISMGNHRQLSRRPKWDLEHFAFST